MGPFYCPGSSAAVVQQRHKHETQPMRQPVMSFADSHWAPPFLQSGYLKALMLGDLVGAVIWGVPSV